MGAKDFGFGLSFFYRILLPGSLLGAASTPLATRALQLFGVDFPQAEAWLIGAFAIVLGVLLSALDDSIYEIYEGRMGWPPRVAQSMTSRWKTYVKDLNRKADAAKQRGDSTAYDELWYELRQFPTDASGDPTATRPTKVGNILAAYEDYPQQRYGMDSVFYWPRLWLRLDKDVREEIDNTWASTDALMYLAAGCLGIGLLYLVSAVVSEALSFAGLSWLISAPSDRFFFAVWGVALIAVSYLPYRLSWAGHLANGENFKSMFDLFRQRLLPDMRIVDSNEREQWRRVWSELQYGVTSPTERSASFAVRLFRWLRMKDGDAKR